jgi:hypothetical protein
MISSRRHYGWSHVSTSGDNAWLRMPHVVDFVVREGLLASQSSATA